MEHSGYLAVMENFHVITRIRNKDECWGELKSKCNCEGCFIRCCCKESLLWSMLLNLELVIPPKYAKREPALCKKKGRPTDKSIARLKEKEVEEDARPYVDKAKQQVSVFSLGFLLIVAPGLHLCVTSSHSCSCYGVGQTP